MTARIALTRGAVTLVDEGDVALVSAHSWHFDGKYAVAAAGLKMHRLILRAPPDLLVDHRDGDGLNNQRSNLRLCSPSANARNAKKKPGRRRYKGVTWTGVGFGWRATVSVDGKKVSVCRLPSEEAAARTYDDLARLHHGEFACVNFPRPG